MSIDSSPTVIIPSAARLIIALASASGAVLSAALPWSVSWGQTVTAAAVQPESGDLDLSSTQPGTAEAFYEADLGTKVSGYVSALLVDIGDSVTKGQVLARIAVPELVQAHNAAIADVKALESEYERVAVLVERKSVTEKTLTEAKNRLDAAIAHRDEIEAQMAYATIEAPFDGIVTSRAIDPGDMVYEARSPKGNAEPLLRVAKLDVIRVKTYLPELAAALVTIGDPATVSFDALPGKPFSGKVSRMAGALDPATRTMLVEIDLPNRDGRIRPGYYGQTRIVFESRAQSGGKRVSE
ncbi:MAG TPA: efflux RND transporter periplasmic adaptor subunit [Gammaproteobacteria bacterium]|nr:efflux RND transporter periplasmic adaptor subunit [Gammaproteobacteria bacterium]